MGDSGATEGFDGRRAVNVNATEGLDGRRAKMMAEFQRASDAAHNALYRRVLAEGGAILASSSSSYAKLR